MPIRTAILGYGRSGSTLHADPIEKISDFEMIAVCDIDQGAREKAHKRFGCNIYDDYQKMLVTEKLDLVVIVTKSDQHCRMTCDCLKAGVNVLVTKPWAVNAKEAREMISTASECGKMLLPWLPARWGCDLLRLKEIINSGVIGKVFQVRRGEYTFGIRNDWQTLEKYGGGYLRNWGPHLVDQPVQLLGTKVKSVFGTMKQIINPGDVEDVFYAVLTMEDGVTVTSEFNIASGPMPNWIIQGDRGTIYVNNMEILIHKVKLPDHIDPTSYAEAPECEVIEEDISGTNAITMQNRYGDPMVIYPSIAEAMLGKRPYDISLGSALHLTEVLDAVRDSNRTNRIVTLK